MDNLNSNSTASKQNLVFKRIFDASLDQVWKVWSDGDQVRRWWGPDGFTAPLAKMDFREGGTSLLCMSSPQMGDFYSTLQYREIVPMKRIEYIHNLADKEGRKINPVKVGMPSDFPQDQLNLITFEAVGENKTEITVTEFGWIPGQMMEMSRIGNEQCLDKINKIFNENQS